jgi:uncharacterized protein (TIGR01777 family)
MRVVVTGATGLIGTRLVAELRRRGDEVIALSRSPERAQQQLGVEARAWRPEDEPAPAAALSGADAVVHLAGENIAQRWSDDAKRRILASREAGTRNLVEGLRAAEPRPGTLISSSAIGWYGARGDERLDESEPRGQGFLADVVAAWEREAERAEELGLRVVRLRQGVVLDKDGGALATMLPFFKAGVGGPVAGGRQWMPWIHADDVVGMITAALADARWEGAVNAVAPEPSRNKDFSKALGRALHRPAVLPVPALALKALYGGMADLVTQGQRVIPKRAEELGYGFRHPDIEEALRSALGQERQGEPAASAASGG